MSLDLGYSYCTRLSKDEEIAMDKQVCINREAVRNLPSNAKFKIKRVIIVSGLVSVVWFSNLESAETIGLSIPPAPVIRFQPSYEHQFEVRISKMIAKKMIIFLINQIKKYCF
nr:hypothetical protein [Naviculales sp.]